MSEPAIEAVDGSYDPSAHPAKDVAAYLGGLTDPQEYDRVVSLEQQREGGPRVTALAGHTRPVVKAGRPLPAGAVVGALPDTGRSFALVDERGSLVRVAGDHVLVP